VAFTPPPDPAGLVAASGLRVAQPLARVVAVAMKPHIVLANHIGRVRRMAHDSLTGMTLPPRGSFRVFGTTWKWAHVRMWLRP
jgi:hypothetical protein